MKHRACLSLVALVGLLPVLAAGETRADQADSSVPPALTKADIDQMMKTLSNWGRWGREDQMGALNLITPEKRKRAAALVTEGVTVSLSHNAVKTEVAGSPPFTQKMVTLPKPLEVTSCGDEYCVAYHGFTQTHMDALCHLFYKGQMYNGFSQKEVTERGAGRLSVINFKQGVFTRCVLMDMPRLAGVRFLEGGHAIYPADLDAWERAAGVKVSSGDAVLIRMGRWKRAQLEGDWQILKSSAGLHASCLPWLKQRDVAVVGSDLALDVLPSRVQGFEMPVHWVVVAMGTPILDNLDLEAVSEAAAARKRWSFLLTVAPLAVEGGTGSPVNPLATF